MKLLRNGRQKGFIPRLLVSPVTMGLYKRRIAVADDAVTSAVHLTLRQSLIPNFLGRDIASIEFTCRL